MVYVSGDGSMVQSVPWGSSRIFGMVFGIFNGFYMFFRTLVNPGLNRHGSEYTRDYRPGSGPPGPPSRRIGRPNTGSGMSAPPGGGCCGGGGCPR